MRTTSGRGSGAAIALLAAILMPLLGFSTVNAQGVGDKVNLLVPDLMDFPEAPALRQFTVMAETPHALWLVQDTCWVDIRGRAVTELDSLLNSEECNPTKWGWGVGIMPDMMSAAEFQNLTQVFENTVWGTVTGTWGEPVLSNPDQGKVWIVIAAIPTKFNAGPGSVIPRNQAYYVNTADLMGEEGGFNAHDIFYINAHAFATNPGYLPFAESARQWNLANGLAALSRYSRNITEEAWLVRGMAEVAQYACFGFTETGGNKYGHAIALAEFEKTPYLELINSTAGPGGSDYAASRGQSFLFFMYLRQRAGDGVISAIAQGDSTGMMNVALALNPSADPETAVQNEVVPLYWDWLICNLAHKYLSDYGGGIYRYDFLIDTPLEGFAHLNMSAAFSLKFKEGDYPIDPGKIAEPAFSMQGPIWCAQYCRFRDLTGDEGPVLFNGQYSDGSGGGSAVNGRWEGKLVAVYEEGSGEFASITDLNLNSFFNGQFDLGGNTSYLIVTNNNPGGAPNLRYYVSQDYDGPTLEAAIHQNQISDNYAHVYAVLLDRDTREMEGFDWVGPVLKIVRDDETRLVKMEPFYGSLMWRGAVSLATDGNYSLNFSGWDSSGIAASRSVEMAVGTMGGALTLEVRGIRLDVPEGGAAPGSRVVLGETGMLGLSLGSGSSLAEASGMLTGVLAGPVSIPGVQGTISFPAEDSDASVFRWNGEGWDRLDSFFQGGRISAQVVQGGIYVLGQAPGISSPSLPAQVELQGNNPNPFTAQTVIRFATPVQGHVSMKVFDLSGRLVRTLANEDMAPANHSVTWDGTDDNGRPLGAGVYFCRLEAQGRVLTQKIMMVE